jgi:serine/threonine-protein kinase
MVAGRYEVDRVLGVGGMGAVVSARDLESGARVAIKSLLPEHCAHPDVMARFQREARATFRLKNEHVARVFDSGALPSGVPYIVMEHLEGRDLKSQVKGAGPLSVKDAAAYVCQACVALAEAHALGIVHRDLKPANLFLTRRLNGAAMIKVLDFGIAKFLSPNIAGDALEMTRTRAVLGSRAYMAPEQMLRPKEVDARADIWALGVILYFLVTGKNPFAAETTEALILRVVQDTPQPLGEVCADLPDGFESVVLRCLSKARENRWANVTELARALVPFTAPDQAGDRATVPLAPQALEQSAPTMRAFAVTSSGTTTTEADRPSVEDWAPTRVMRPRPRARRRRPAVVIAGGVSAGFFGALLVLHLRTITMGAPAASSPVQAAVVAPLVASSQTPAPAEPPKPAPAATLAEAAPAPRSEPTTVPAAVQTATPRVPKTAAVRPKPRPVQDSPW